MFDYQRKKRGLLHQLADLDKKHQTEVERAKQAYDPASPKEDLFYLVEGQYKTQRKDIEMKLELLESDYLASKSERYRIQKYPPMRTYEPNLVGVKSRAYFPEESRRELRKLIYEARRSLWKDRVAIFSPLATVIISTLALLISALALYLQFTRRH